MHSSTYHCISLFTSLTARSQSFRQDTPSPRGLTQNVLGTYTWHQSKRRLQLSYRLPVRKVLESLVNNGGDHPGLLMQCYGKNTIETSNIHRAWILRLFIQLSRLIEPSNTESTGNVKAQFLESLLLNDSTGCIRPIDRPRGHQCLIGILQGFRTATQGTRSHCCRLPGWRSWPVKLHTKA